MTTATRAIAVSYAQRSRLLSDKDGAQVLLALNDEATAAPPDSDTGAAPSRSVAAPASPVGVRGTVRDPSLLRDALLTAAAVLGSDLRYKGKDRTAYLAYLAKKGKRATAAIWEAQKAFLDESLATDEKPAAVLPPLLTVHPDEVSLEVFSRDESAYARLAFASELLTGRQAAHGTSFVDLSPSLLSDLDRLRAHQPVLLEAGARLPAPTARSGDGSGGAFAQSLAVPYAWLRSFLQVQTAATLSMVECELSPIDFYNVLFALRTRKAKKSPRALRFELVPGAAPRLIIEPWEIVLEGHGAPFRGKSPAVVRTFGRQRLLALGRLLPHLRRARALLLGPGLPVFWVLELGAATLTLALTGWTESGWASVAAFDALMPAHGPGADRQADRVQGLLAARGPLSLNDLSAAASLSAEETRGVLKLLCLRGTVLYDIARGVYRPRSLLPQGQLLDVAELRYGNPREARAHRLLGDGSPGKGEVKLQKIHEIAGEGTLAVEIHGEIADKEARRTYATHFTIDGVDSEGRVKDAACTCPLFRRSGLREGPCEHLLALRLAYARRRAEEERLRQTPEGRKLIRAETRTLIRRESEGQETVYRVSLDARVVRLIWGLRTSTAQRQQRLWFDSDEKAREAYFNRLSSLAKEGFIDAGSAA